jgi:hypothetical protein
MNPLRVAAIVGAASLAGATPLAAAAAGALPADKQYGNPISNPTSGGVAGQGNQLTSGGVAGQGNQLAAQTSDLPFTGFDAGLVVVGGLTLVGLGLGLRRVSRRNSH